MKLRYTIWIDNRDLHEVIDWVRDNVEYGEYDRDDRADHHLERWTWFTFNHEEDALAFFLAFKDTHAPMSESLE